MKNPIVNMVHVKSNCCHRFYWQYKFDGRSSFLKNTVVDVYTLSEAVYPLYFGMIPTRDQSKFSGFHEERRL